jgi:hypothetical protein
MAYKLLAAAQERWRRFNGHELVVDVLAGARFKDGIRVTDDDHHDDDETTNEKVAASQVPRHSRSSSPSRTETCTPSTNQ